jgi:hypothetical protein
MRQPRQLAVLGRVFGALDAVPCSFGKCLEWRDKSRCLLAFRDLACEGARRGALPGPSELASWWKSVAVEAERLGCGGRTCVRGEGSWIRVSAALCPHDAVYGRGILFSSI